MKKIAITCILIAVILTGIFQTTFKQPESVESILEVKSYTLPTVDLYPQVVDPVPF